MKSLMKPSVLWSLFLGLDVLIFDRLHKYYQIDFAGWTGGEVVPVTPFFDYILVWNTGISYGMLSWLPAGSLLFIMGLAVVALCWWWVKDESLLTRLGIAVAVGGAISNAIDRLVYGAVADFFHFHWGNLSFYVFNLADIAISLGVVLLIFDVLFPRTKIAEQS